MVRTIRWTAVLVAVVELLGASEVRAQNDSVNGSGAAGPDSFTMLAVSGPSGELATGDVFFSVSAEDVWLPVVAGSGTGVVQHLCVSGNRAVITGAVDSGVLVGSGFVYFVEDRTASGLPDLIQIQILEQIPAACPTFAMTAPRTLTVGDIVVTDALSSTPSDQLDGAVPCTGPFTGGTWKNHGQYMRGVAQTVDSMVEGGVITEDQGDALVSGRAQNGCGAK